MEVEQHCGSLLAAFPLHNDRGFELVCSLEDGEGGLLAATLLDTDQVDLSLMGEGEETRVAERREQAMGILDVTVVMENYRRA